MGNENIGKCRFCGQRIKFITMKSGKSMPVDEKFIRYKITPGGKDKLVTPQGEVVTCISGNENVGVDEIDGYGYVSHFATCTSRKK